MAIPQNHLVVIKVVGVGGGGVSTMNRMIEVGLKDVEFIAVNTGAQALLISDAETKLDIGRELTHGLGAGADSAIGRKVAEDHIDEITVVLEGADTVFVTAGEGGGIDTGAAPAVAKIACDAGAPTVGVVTRPFSFEGNRRVAQVGGGATTLYEEIDTLIVIPSDRLLEVSDANISVLDAFRAADQVLLSGAQGTIELITTPGPTNADFNDVRSVMKDTGSALMGIGAMTGEDRALHVAESAISSPLLEVSIDGAHGVFMFFRDGSDFSLQEVYSSLQLVREVAHPEASIIFDNVIDDAPGDEIHAMVIAAGLDEATDAALSRPNVARVSAPAAQQRPVAPEAKAPATEVTCITQLSARRPQHRADVAAPVCVAAPAPVETPAAAEYEEFEPEHSFEVLCVYSEVSEKEELDTPPSLR